VGQNVNQTAPAGLVGFEPRAHGRLDPVLVSVLRTDALPQFIAGFRSADDALEAASVPGIRHTPLIT